MSASDVRRWDAMYAQRNLGTDNVGRPIITKGGAHVLKGKARLFSGQRGGELNYRMFDKSLKRAREAVMTPEQVQSALTRTLYDWRHLCLTNWLNRGVPPATVAMWAGNSVPVLLAIYVNVVDNEAVLLRRLEGMYDDPPAAAEDDPDMP